jgi:hypothetical protein
MILFENYLNILFIIQKQQQNIFLCLFLNKDDFGILFLMNCNGSNYRLLDKLIPGLVGN